MRLTLATAARRQKLRELRFSPSADSSPLPDAGSGNHTARPASGAPTVDSYVNTVTLGDPGRLYDAINATDAIPARAADGEPMSLTKEDVHKLIDVYIRAWTTQDPDLILTVFTPTATYHERVLQQPIRDHAGIREYWQTKVVKEQTNIEAELLSLYVDGATAIAEWEARFDDVVEGYRKRMREVAILEFEDDRIASLREYWASERVGS